MDLQTCFAQPLPTPFIFVYFSLDCRTLYILSLKGTLNTRYPPVPLELVEKVELGTLSHQTPVHLQFAEGGRPPDSDY